MSDKNWLGFRDCARIHPELLVVREICRIDNAERRSVLLTVLGGVLGMVLMYLAIYGWSLP